MTGSDRYLDLGRPPPRLAKLQRLGVELFAQDGSGVDERTRRVVVSTAIEDDNPDPARAKALGIPIVHRSALLAELFHGAARRVAVTGSCGKTTVTAMVAWLLDRAGQAPTVINGGVMRNFESETCVGNAVSGAGELCVIEADESDGSCVHYRPTVGVVTGLARDHKEKAELIALFQRFADQTEEVVVLNADEPALAPLGRGRRVMTYGFSEGAEVRGQDVRCGAADTRFRVGDTPYALAMVGAHNAHNALAALAALRAMGVRSGDAQALAAFRGVQRRLEIAGQARGARVYDDYAHNPSKIAAAIEAVRSAGATRVLAVFQPHGFGPARFMKDDLVATLRRALTPEDRAWLLPIYDVGGTASRDISSERIADEARAPGCRVAAAEDREALTRRIAELCEPGDAVLVMGARDDTLTDLARDLARAIARP